MARTEHDSVVQRRDRSRAASDGAGAEPRTASGGLRGRWALDLRQLLWLVVFGICLVDHQRFLSADADLVTHIALGRHLLASGFPTDNPLLYTTDVPPVLHEWLFEAVMAWLDRMAGLGWPLVLSALAAATTPALVYGAARRRGAEVGVASAAALLCLVGVSFHLLARPHLWSLALMVWWWTSTSARWYGGPAQGSARAARPVLMVLWVNLHGGFVQALVLGALALAGDTIDLLWRGSRAIAPREVGREALVLAACAVAVLVNPYGVALVSHIIGFLGDAGGLASIDDFRPLSLEGSGRAATAAFVITCAAFIPAVVMGWRRLRTGEIVVLAALALWCVAAVRNIPVFAVVGGLILAPVAQQAIDARVRRPRVARLSAALRAATARIEPQGVSRSWRWPMAAFLVAAAVLAVVRVPLAGPTVPVEGLRVLNERPHLRARHGYTAFMLGGYVVYATPIERVFIHPLNAAYPASLFARYDAIQQGADLHQTFGAYGIGWALVDRHDAVHRALARDGCWSSIASDRTAELLERRPACASSPAP